MFSGIGISGSAGTSGSEETSEEELSELSGSEGISLSGSEEDSSDEELSEGSAGVMIIWLELLSEEPSVISGSSEQPEHKRRARTVIIIKIFFI